MRHSGRLSSSASAAFTQSSAGAPSISSALGQQPPAEPEILLGQDHPRAGRAPRRAPPQVPPDPPPITSTSQNAYGLLVMVGVGRVGGAAEARGAADRRLVDLLPEAPPAT